MRFFDLILALLLLAALVLIARREFPGYAERAVAPPAIEAPSPAPSPAGG